MSNAAFDVGKERSVEEETQVELGRRQSAEEGKSYDEHVRVRESRPKERLWEDRGRRERSIEEDWAEGDKGGRRGPPARGRGEW